MSEAILLGCRAAIDRAHLRTHRAKYIGLASCLRVLQVNAGISKFMQDSREAVTKPYVPTSKALASNKPLKNKTMPSSCYNDLLTVD